MEHTADVGIEAEGKDIAEAFSSGADALFGLIADTSGVAETREIIVMTTAPSLDLLFVEALNELISLRDMDNLAFKRVHSIEIDERPDGWHFRGVAAGEPLDLDRHEVRTEVKAATYAGLKYEFKDGVHRFTCVLDV